MEDKLVDLIYKNNIRLIEYIMLKVQDAYECGNIGRPPDIPEEINIPNAIREDTDWIYDEEIDIPLAIQIDKKWIKEIDQEIMAIIQEDKNWDKTNNTIGG